MKFSEFLKEAMPLKGHEYHTKSDIELRGIQKDANEAAKAMKGHDPKAEAKYLDQINDASTVLYYRQKNGGKQLPKSSVVKEATIKNFADPDHDPKIIKMMGDAYDHLNEREKEAASNFVDAAKTLGGTLTLSKAKSWQPTATIKALKFKHDSVTVDLVYEQFSNQEALKFSKPIIKRSDVDLMATIKHVFKKASNKNLLSTDFKISNSDNKVYDQIVIGYFSEFDNANYKSLVKGIQSILKVLESSSISESIERNGGPLKVGERIKILPKYQDKGDDKFEWYVVTPEEKGRLDIGPKRNSELKSSHLVQSYMVERFS